jgi:hypothetical protein
MLVSRLFAIVFINYLTRYLGICHDEESKCLLEKLGISRCNVAIIDIKNGEEFLHSNGELAV